MSFILIPKNGEEIKINAWNWRATLELLLKANVINADLHEWMGTSGRGTNVDAETAAQIADLLDERLGTMKPGDRIRADLTVTNAPKKPMIFKPEMEFSEIDAVDAYSATYAWLVLFRDFARKSDGFEII